jgi:hypothetical protein
LGELRSVLLTFLIRYRRRNLQQIDFPEWNADKLGLSSTKPSGQVGVPKHTWDATNAVVGKPRCTRNGMTGNEMLTSCTIPPHGIAEFASVRVLACARKVVFAESAFATSNLERGHHAISRFYAGDLGTDVVNDATEFVSQDVSGP